MPKLREHSIDLEAGGERSPDWRRRRSREKRLGRVGHNGAESVCRSKVAYRSKAEAWSACVGIGRRYSRLHNEPYRCRVCKRFHVRTTRGAETLRLTPEKS